MDNVKILMKAHATFVEFFGRDVDFTDESDVRELDAICEDVSYMYENIRTRNKYVVSEEFEDDSEEEYTKECMDKDIYHAYLSYIRGLMSESDLIKSVRQLMQKKGLPDMLDYMIYEYSEKNYQKRKGV